MNTRKNEFNHLHRQHQHQHRPQSVKTAITSTSQARSRTVVLFLIGLGVIIVAGGLAMGLSGCGDNNSSPNNSSPNTASTTLISSVSGGSGSGGAADPYENLDPQQVIDTYLKAYQAGDWPKCLALISPSVKAGWTSPDELSLKAAQAQREGGPLVIDRYGPLQGSPDNFLVISHRELPANAPTVTPLKSLGGGTIGPERNATAQASYLTSHAEPNKGTFEVTRIGKAYKITAYTIL